MSNTRSDSRPGARVTGLGSKGRWNTADAGQALTAYQGSGMSLAAFARREGMSLTRLAWWRKKLQDPARPSAAPMRWLPVAIRRCEPARPQVSSVEIVVRGGRVIRVTDSFDAEMLVQVIETLERLAC